MDWDHIRCVLVGLEEDAKDLLLGAGSVLAAMLCVCVWVWFLALAAHWGWATAACWGLA